MLMTPDEMLEYSRLPAAPVPAPSATNSGIRCSSVGSLRTACGSMLVAGESIYARLA